MLGEGRGSRRGRANDDGLLQSSGKERLRRKLLFAVIFITAYLLGTTPPALTLRTTPPAEDPAIPTTYALTTHTPFNCTTSHNTDIDFQGPRHSNKGRAVNEYIEKVQSSIAGKLDYCNSNSIPSALDMNTPLNCLRETTPSLTLQYPCDAEAHMNEIRSALAPWAQHAEHVIHTAAGYSGPWIENIWIDKFEKLYDQSDNSTCVWDLFGPFIPIFVPWVDHWVGPKRYKYPPELLDALKKVLRPNVPYITVSQSDDGLVGKNELNMDMFPNLLVLSAGGYGHVPVPLFKQEEPPNRKPVSERAFMSSFVGSLKTDRVGIRGNMHKYLNNIDKETSGSSGGNTTSIYKYYYGENWRSIMADSRFSLVPRGYGRTAYHLIETLQMGLVPVHIYSDVPWVPYADLNVVMVSSTNQIDALVDELRGMAVEQIEERENRIISLRESHFSPIGIMQQIEMFMNGKGNDLRCQTLPPSPRGV